MLRRVTVAYTVNEFGNWLGAVALTVAVFDHTHSAVASAALFVALYFLPALVVTGVVAWLESLARPKLLATIYLLQALVTIGLALLVRHPILAPVLVLGAVVWLAGMCARALVRAFVSQRSADDAARRTAMGRLNAAWAVTFAIGPAVAGVLCTALGPSAVLLLDAASFVTTALLMFDIQTRGAEDRPRLSEQLRAVVSHVRSNAGLAWLLGTESVAVVFFASVVPVEIVLVKVALHSNDSGYGALLAAWGVGTVVGSIAFARARSLPVGGLLAGSTFAVAIGYLGMAASSSVAMAGAFALIGGVGNGIQWIAVVTAVQEQTPSDLQARLMGVLEAVGALFPAAGFALGGALAALWGARVAFVVAGSAAVLATFVFARSGALAGPDRRFERAQETSDRPLASFGASEEIRHHR